MRHALVAVLNDEWEYRRKADPTLPALTITEEDVMELEANEGAAYIDHCGIAFADAKINPMMCPPGLTEPNITPHASADACGMRSGTMVGTLYLVVVQDANRHNVIRSVEFRGSVESLSPGWVESLETALRVLPHLVRDAIVPHPDRPTEPVVLASPVLKSDKDKGLQAAADRLGMDTWPCTNHGTENMKKHTHSSADGEVYRQCARATNARNYDRFFQQLSDKAKAYVTQQCPKETHSLAFHPVRCIDNDTTQNAAETTNNAIQKAREATTPLAMMQWIVDYHCKMFWKVREAADKETHKLPPRERAEVAASKDRCHRFRSGQIGMQFVDNTKMIADFPSPRDQNEVPLRWHIPAVCSA
jgi:hypothetical protein